MNTAIKYSLTLKQLKAKNRKVAITLRKTIATKEACEDAGYLVYYPHLLTNITTLKDEKSITKKDIRVYSKLLKKELKNENNI